MPTARRHQPAGAGAAGETATSRWLLKPWLELVFLAGMAGVFLANAVVAVLQPTDFTRLLQRSSLAGPLGLGGSWMASVIAVNDLALGVALMAAFARPRWRQPLLAWCGLWLLAVTAVKLTAL